MAKKKARPPETAEDLLDYLLTTVDLVEPIALKLNDLSVALVGSSLLDFKLKELLCHAFVDDQKLLDFLLRHDGPLGTFGSRIAVAFAIGLISEMTRSDLKLVCDIRNEFAHKYPPPTFNDKPVADWCRRLRIQKAVNPDAGEPPSLRPLFAFVVHQLWTALDNRMQSTPRFSPPSGPLL